MLIYYFITISLGSILFCVLLRYCGLKKNIKHPILLSFLIVLIFNTVLILTAKISGSYDKSYLIYNFITMLHLICAPMFIGGFYHWGVSKRYKLIVAASKNNDVNALDDLIKSSTDIDQNNLMPYAIDNNQPDVIKVLLKKGAAVNDGFLRAVEKGNLEAVDLLISNGASLAEKDFEGNTALVLAVMNNHLKIAEYLIEKGADINAKKHNGDTVLIIAAENGYRDILELLIANRANISTKDKKGHSALWHAGRNSYAEIANILKQHGATGEYVEELSISTTKGSTVISLNNAESMINSFIDKGFEYGTEQLKSLQRSQPNLITLLKTFSQEDQDIFNVSGLLTVFISSIYRPIPRVLEPNEMSNIITSFSDIFTSKEPDNRIRELCSCQPHLWDVVAKAAKGLASKYRLDRMKFPFMLIGLGAILKIYDSNSTVKSQETCITNQNKSSGPETAQLKKKESNKVVPKPSCNGHPISEYADYPTPKNGYFKVFDNGTVISSDPIEIVGQGTVNHPGALTFSAGKYGFYRIKHQGSIEDIESFQRNVSIEIE
jgi:hypothetical protein